VSKLVLNLSSRGNVTTHRLTPRECGNKKFQQEVICFNKSPHAIFWDIWSERNRKVFEGVEIPLQCFKDNFIKSLYFWDKWIFCYSSFDLLDFVDSVHMGCV